MSLSAILYVCVLMTSLLTGICLEADRRVWNSSNSETFFVTSERISTDNNRLQMYFTYAGRDYNITLRSAPTFLDVDFVLLRRFDNFTTIVQVGEESQHNCYFWGQVRRKGTLNLGRIAVSLCKEMIGIMEIDGNEFVIEPYSGVKGGIRSKRDELQRKRFGPQIMRPIPHQLKFKEGRADGNYSSGCLDRDDKNNANDGYPTRSRRATDHSPLTVELAVFVDLSLQRQMKDLYGDHTVEEISRFVMAMVNAMELLYDDPSIGRSVKFALKRLELLETEPSELERHRDINSFLTRFCQWQRRHNPAGDEHPLHWDHAVLLTGVDLYTSSDVQEVNRQVVGFAPVGGMCSLSNSCTVNEGKDFESVYIVAHEIGHSLGMQHDGQGNDCNKEKHIMSPTLGTGKNTWSSCSRNYINRFAATKQADCLKDSLQSDTVQVKSGSLPGERIGADEQCRLKYGPSSERADDQSLAEICVSLHCKYDHHRWTSHPALEGTSCGYDTWCRRGRCVSRHNGSVVKLPSQIDGGWSDWSAFSPCASSCLRRSVGDLIGGSVGLRERFRRCNNPYPSSEGVECKGNSHNYETCDASALCRRAEHRSVSEYATEICLKAADSDYRLLGQGVRRSTSNHLDACNIWCARRDGGFQRHRQTFPNGVRCSTHASIRDQPQLCVEGRCQTFSCQGDSPFFAGLEYCGRQALPEVSNALSLPVHESPRRSVWRSYSRCRHSCTSPSKGLELVERRCLYSDCGVSGRSVRHCSPKLSETSCGMTSSSFIHATNVCRRYREKLGLFRLSGVGMQLSASDDDPDRPCTVTCQDRDNSLRFYRVKGREGWMPSGVDCARGERGRTALCLSGRCVDFGPDRTPLQQTRYDYAYLFEASFSGGRRRTTRTLQRPSSSNDRGSWRTAPKLRRVDKQFIRELISDLELESNDTSSTATHALSPDDIDLEDPLILSELPSEYTTHLGTLEGYSPYNRSKYSQFGHAFAFGEPEHRVWTARNNTASSSDPSNTIQVHVFYLVLIFITISVV